MRAKGAGRGEEATEKLGTVGDLGAVGTTVLSGPPYRRRCYVSAR